MADGQHDTATATDKRTGWDLLHAYWRMEYIQTPKEERGPGGNPFRDLATQDDEAAMVVARGEHGAIVMNKYPYNAGHLLVLPYREVPDLTDLTEAERGEMMELIVEGKEMLRAAFQPDGFNIGFNLGESAGAGIPGHLHAHIVPRWSGDTNFMPVVGQTRVLPQSLHKMWQRLREFA